MENLSGLAYHREERRSGMLRVIDESGEDYLYPERFFSRVIVPQETLEKLTHTKQ
jgi:hypothetical protein